jgi:hypothetical protein
VQSRGLAPRQNAQIPTFPQKFDVQGPEADSFGFAVTQPGPVLVDVESNGAPIEVTLIGPASAPVKQRGTGQVHLTTQATSQDIQRSFFWHVQIHAWCTEDCLRAAPRPRSSGSVTVQHPPVNQTAVQQALQAMATQQKQLSAQKLPQTETQAATQMEQAFQQRKAQFERRQLDRRASLIAQIQPQLDQLKSRMGMAGMIRSRGLEQTEEISAEIAPAERQALEESVGTRAVPQMTGKLGVPGQSATQLPAFPQKFDLQGPETDSFGFAVTQPGPIQVDVEAQGAPVIVTMQHLTSPPLSQQGIGQIHLAYQVTPQDVQKSALWVVRIRLAQSLIPLQLGRAGGTIMVQHPPADTATVQAQTTALAEQERANQGRLAAEAEAQSRADFQQFKARIEQQHMERQASERAQNQGIIDQLRAKAGGMIRSRGITPVIDRLNKNQGQPKDQVIVYGRNFGTGGEVRFQVGPNIRGNGVVEAWSDTVVVVDVPDASGLLQFDGNISISTGQVQSNALPFRFVPVPEVREIRSTRGDISIAQPGSVIAGQNRPADKAPDPQGVGVSGSGGGGWERITHDNTTFMQLGGSKGNDIFFPTTRLQNGWVVQDIKPKAEGCGTPFCTGVIVVDSRMGTDTPFFNVRWWYDALANLKYRFSIWIVGPRGVPDGIAMTGSLQPVIPAGTVAPESAPSVEPPQATAVPLAPGLLPPVMMKPGTSTPPTGQPSGGQSGSSEPPTVTAVPVNPALLGALKAAPGSGTIAPSGTTAPPSGGTTQASGGTSTPQQQGPTTPTITSLSVPQGQPGDPVMINGNNFGSGSGEIHFVIANGKDVVAPAGVIWSDTQIFTSVPDATGLLAFNGQVYVKRAADQKMSNLVAFRFEPTLEIREIRGTMDRVLTDPVWRGLSSAGEIDHGRMAANFLVGDKNNDEFFINTRLKNGWVADDATVTCKHDACNGGAYLWEIKTGGDWPYLNVRWWLNPDPPFGFSDVKYNFAVRIIGPKGVPDGVAVAQ